MLARCQREPFLRVLKTKVVSCERWSQSVPVVAAESSGKGKKKGKDDTHTSAAAKDAHVLDPLCSQTFSSREALLDNKLVHSTSPEACASITRTRTFIGSVPDDERYDGFGTNVDASSVPIPRTYFDVRPASDGLLFPFSRYPKDVAAGSDIRLLSLDVRVLLRPEYSMFYAMTTPTQFGESFMKVYHTQVAVTTRGTPEERFALENLQRLDKYDNEIFRFGNSDQASMSTKVFVNSQSYPHAVVISSLGGLTYPSDKDVTVHNGTKYSFSSRVVECPASGCNFTCNTIPRLKIHYGAAHTDYSFFQCDRCDKHFASKHALSHHERTHSQAFVCTSCGKQFSANNNLQLHISAVHDNALIPCPQCDKTFSTKFTLSAHLQSVHRRAKLHRCTVCDKEFSTNSHLRSHVSAVHLGEKPHVCTECSRSFSDRRNLTQHVFGVHRGDKPHVCDVCQSAFSRRSSLKVHLSKVHARASVS